MPATYFEPFIEELSPVPDAREAFLRLRGLPHCLWLDSARRHAALGRYSFLAADPFDYFELPVSGPDALAILAQKISPFQAATVADLPPFQGGAAGLMAYDLGRQYERLPPPRIDEFKLPALAMGLYDVVVAWDHECQRAWLISHGWPEIDEAARRRHARERLDQFRGRLAAEPKPPQRPQTRSIAPSDLALQFAVGGMPGLTSTFSHETYLQAVRRAIDYIEAGDVFQVNLAQRLLYPAHDDASELYLRLRERNAATFAAYFDLGEFQIASASPERFLSVRAGQVEARPIKGTRQRTRWPEADLFAGDELRLSEKDRAENVMIVDLLRNDLARVCRAESVCVTQLCELETYEYVQHLVSAVRGTLREGCRPLDLLRAAFPGGSITGAPKVRAMEIIAELEPTARGAYCGSLVYVGFDGTLDASILIRTVTAGRGWWQFPVGGGIVAQSVPALEYDETWHKAEGLLRSLR
ncbi:MAG TPA: anthranilate synthase component I family protein [Pirellulales bacterium]|nr:anthranilate synthase component I family protein [Pirellulales bacterium]